MARHTGMLPIYSVAVAAIMWGAWWIPLRVLDERGIAVDWASVTLGSASALALLPVAIMRWRKFCAGGRDLLLVGLFTGATFAAFNHALITGYVVRAVLLFYLAPIWATVLAVVILRERFGAYRFASILIGIIGAAVVLGVDEGLPLPRSRADWMGLAAGLTWAFGVTFIRKAADVSSIEKTVAGLVGSAVCALIFAVTGTVSITPEWQMIGASLPLIAGATLLWLIPMTLIEFWGASRMDPGRVCIVLLLEVVAAAVTATALTEEPFGWREITGSVLIIGAGLIELRDQARAVVAPTPS